MEEKLMEYLLTLEEAERLKGKITQLEQEAMDINSKISNLIRSNDDFFNSSNHNILKKRVSVDIPKEKRTILDRLNRVKIVSKDDYPFISETVSFFSKVTLDYDGEIETYSVLPVCEDNMVPNVMSCNSPIAKLIIGKKKSDYVECRGITVKILNVEEI